MVLLKFYFLVAFLCHAALTTSFRQLDEVRVNTVSSRIELTHETPTCNVTIRWVIIAVRVTHLVALVPPAVLLGKTPLCLR